MNVKLIGGATCLDFVNTVGGWVRAPGRSRVKEYNDTVLREKLPSAGDLVTWGRLAGVISGRDRLSVENPDAVLARALSLRSALYRIFKATLEGWRPGSKDVAILNEELSVATAHQRLTYESRGFTWVWDIRPNAAERVLWVVSRSAAELLTSSVLAGLRQCPGDRCGWLFLDASRNHSRQWCDMRDCGNRAKVRRFRTQAR